jgi:hypothetical protein
VLPLDPASALLVRSIWRPLQGASFRGGRFPVLKPWAMLSWPLQATEDAGIPKVNNDEIPADYLLEMSKLHPKHSYLATIGQSLRDKIHSTAQALLKLALMG